MGETQERLVHLARSGDKEAFAELVSLFMPRVYRAACAFTGNEEDAKDLSQDAFLRAFKGIGRFRGQSAFFTWLYGILFNAFKTWRRKQGRSREIRGELFSGNTPAEPVDPAPSGLQQASDREEVNRVYKAIFSLPDKQKATIVMHCLDQMTYAEIAQAMRCSIGTVKSRLHTARLAVRCKLRLE